MEHKTADDAEVQTEPNWRRLPGKVGWEYKMHFFKTFHTHAFKCSSSKLVCEVLLSTQDLTN